MATDFADWTKGTVVFPNLTQIVAQDFPDWTDGIVQITGAVAPNQDFPDWVKTTEVDTTVPVRAPNTGGSGGFNAFGNSVTVNAPANIKTGDLMVATVVAWLTSTTNIASTGWTRQDYQQGTDPNTDVALLTKVATASEPATYTFTVTTGGTANPLMVLIEKYTGPAALDGAAQFKFLNTSVTNMDAASITPTQTGDTLIVFYFSHGTNGGATFTTPTGMFAENNTGHSGVNYMQAFDSALSSTAPTGTIRSVTSDSGDYLAYTVLVH